MDATYESGAAFKVTGDYSDIFVEGRRIKAYCGGDGYKWGTIQTVTYPYETTKTLVNLESVSSDTLTSNLESVAWSKVKPGDEGNQSPKFEFGNYLIELLYDSVESLQKWEKKLATDTAGSYFEERIARSRGSVGTPTNISTGDAIYRQKIRTYINGDWYDALWKTVVAYDTTGSNVVTKEVLTGKGTSGSSYVIEERYGDGIIGWPNQSRARVTKATATGLAATSTTLASWSVEDYDTQDEMALGSGVFSPTHTGGFHVDVMRTFDTVGTSTSAGSYEVRLVKNGTAIVTKQTVIKSAADGAVLISVGLSCDLDLDAADYIQVDLFQDSGTSVNSYGSTINNYWNVRKVW